MKLKVIKKTSVIIGFSLLALSLLFTLVMSIVAGGEFAKMGTNGFVAGLTQLFSFKNSNAFFATVFTGFVASVLVLAALIILSIIRKNKKSLIFAVTLIVCSVLSSSIYAAYFSANVEAAGNMSLFAYIDGATKLSGGLFILVAGLLFLCYSSLSFFIYVVLELCDFIITKEEVSVVSEGKTFEMITVEEQFVETKYDGSISITVVENK